MDDIKAQILRLVVMRFTRVVFGVSANCSFSTQQLESLSKFAEKIIIPLLRNSIDPSMWMISPLERGLTLRHLSCMRSQDSV